MNTSTAELKAYLHKLIVETDDVQILSKVQASFTTLKSENVDWWDTISEKEKELIQSGLQQLEAGEGIPHNMVRERATKLLVKK